MDAIFTITQLPSMLATKGQACFQCQKQKAELAVPLQRCSGCSRVYYCGSDCQKANWSEHKALCRALRAIEVKHAMVSHTPFVVSNMHREAYGFIDVCQLNAYLDQVSQIELLLLQVELGRPLSRGEIHILAGEPRCLGCGRSDRILRIEARQQNLEPEPSVLKPCPRCHLSFYCSKEHWEATKQRHRNQCFPGRYNLPQCEVNQLYLEDNKFALYMRDKKTKNGDFRWTPRRRISKWKSLKDVGWPDFAPDIEAEFGQFPSMRVMMKALVRGVTEALAMPMTVLWALENLNDNDAWTRKEILNIHLLGVTVKELINADVFVEMLRRLPLLKYLTLEEFKVNEVTIPPFALTVTHPTEQKITYICQPGAYHDYIADQGERFIKPDLAAALDPVLPESDEVNPWTQTVASLVKLKIPSVFTALVLEDANSLVEMLQEAGAVLHPELGLGRNPWGSMIVRAEPNKITGFFSQYEWLAGGFC